jgi:hypothetical protein
MVLVNEWSWRGRRRLPLRDDDDDALNFTFLCLRRRPPFWYASFILLDSAWFFIAVNDAF